MAANPCKPKGKKGGYHPSFVHYRNGKRYWAKDYGYKAWPF